MLLLQGLIFSAILFSSEATFSDGPSFAAEPGCEPRIGPGENPIGLGPGTSPKEVSLGKGEIGCISRMPSSPASQLLQLQESLILFFI